MATVQELRVISPSELDEVLDQARTEHWRELALIGPRAPGSWPVRATPAFRLRQPLGVQVAQLAALTQLTQLDLSGNSIGANGVRALAALTQLNDLDLSANGDRR